MQCFGLGMVRLDIRQESTRHNDVLDTITTYLGLGSYKCAPILATCTVPPGMGLMLVYSHPEPQASKIPRCLVSCTLLLDTRNETICTLVVDTGSESLRARREIICIKCRKHIIYHAHQLDGRECECRTWSEKERLEWLQSELTGKRPLLPPGMATTAEVAEVLSTFRILAELPPDSLGAYIISMAHTASDVLAVVLLQVPSVFSLVHSAMCSLMSRRTKQK